ncbi:MAG TPA: helix-turn-helix domain-containing protein [Patescibacteria group bacterium]|nr:helix-turn-helix domain-containing protein [Patescibacteria group bacterium]
MKFIKQNFMIIIVLIILLVNVFMLRNLQVKFNDLSTQYFMLRSSVENISNNSNYYQQGMPANAVKEVMSPLDLANYLDIDMVKVYEIVTRDNTMPYIQIDGEYRFSKTAIDKWMETRMSIQTW